MKQPASLEDRILAAFKDGARSEDFSGLIADAEAAAKAATSKAAVAREKALDPRCAAAEVESHRKAMEDCQFRSDRMNVAAKKLAERHRAVAAKEEDAQRTIVYNKAVRERDALATELAQRYPQLCAELADLLHRVAANNREIAAVKLPESQSRILEAECVARNIRGFVLGTAAVSLVEEVRLPAWEGDAHHRYAYNASDIPLSANVVRQIRA